MDNRYEVGRENLDKLAKWYRDNSANRNEATTRLHMIDRLFFECLCWSRDDSAAEERFGNTYTDYSFYCPWRSLIVEAKKEGIYFELPAGYQEHEYLLRSLCRDNQQIKEAVTQVMAYCQERGTPLATVCNGHQLISFIASRNDGVPPIDGRALVFSSLESMLQDFLVLWRYLSKPGVQDNNLHNHLSGTDVAQIPSKLSNALVTYPGIKGRNVLQTDLQIVGELVIEDIARTRDIEEEFLRECFCTSGALSQYALVSRTILKQRYTALFSPESSGPLTIPIMTKKGEVAITSELLAESLSKRPILLLGDVGVGKTMFIRYLRKVAGADVMKDALVLYIDLGSQAAISSDLRSFFLSDTARQLFEQYEVDIEERNFVRGVYHFALERFSKGIYSDLRESDVSAYRLKELQFLEAKVSAREEHLKECLVHLSKARRKQIVLFIDNADQRDAEVQQQAFLVAQEVAANWPVTVFMSIRPQTFHRSKKFGSLSGYHPKAFTIAPPRVDEVVRKRLEFARRIAKGELALNLPSHINISFSELDRYLGVLLYSFGYNRELIEFIDNVSNGNIRMALEFVTTFIGSGHVDTQKILAKDAEDEKVGKHYLVPLHEFLRAVIFGDNIQYDPLTSPIANIFDIATPDPREHFLISILLEYLSRAASFAGISGFVETQAIFDYLQSAGFTPSQVSLVLNRALRSNLIETEARRITAEGDSLPRMFRATTVGLYHVNRLPAHFTYLDAVVVDTPILDD